MVKIEQLHGIIIVKWYFKILR